MHVTTVNRYMYSSTSRPTSLGSIFCLLLTSDLDHAMTAYRSRLILSPTASRCLVATYFLHLILLSDAFLPQPVPPLRVPRQQFGSTSRSNVYRFTSLAAAASAGTVVTKGFDSIFSFTKICFGELKALNAVQTALFLSTFLLGILLGRTKPFWKRFTNVLDIPTSYFGPDAKMLKGRAVRVSDGDTIRFFHCPMHWWPWSRTMLVKGEKLSKTALPIRICTIDTPETAKFGKSGQPFGPEAKAKMKELVENKMVRVKLLQTDQYARAVASVYTGHWPFRKPVDEIMLKEGLAEVYQGGGAVYGAKGLEGYLELQEEAKGNKIGMWSMDDRESAAEYKKRTK